MDEVGFLVKFVVVVVVVSAASVNLRYYSKSVI